MMTKRQTNLSANLVAFCRHLRQHEFTIGPSEERDALRAVQLINPFSSSLKLELCLQTALCKTPVQLKKFPKLYQNYWRELDRAVDSKTTEKPEENGQQKSKSRNNSAKGVQTLKNWLQGKKNKEVQEAASYSDGGFGKVTEQVDFTNLEMKEVFQLVQKLVQKIANRRSRRYRTTRKRAVLDLKKSIRKNVVRNGEIVHLIYKKKKKDNLRVVLLCDVSRSMELYSRFFVQFMYAFQSLFPKIETFAFATTLHHISKALHTQSVNESLEKVIQQIPDWSGGTRIGASLAKFNQDYGHKYLTSKTLVLILSDGWDTDAVDLVGENMRQIHRKALQVLWLNPLAGSADWQPEVRGMKAAMPYVDALLPFYNVESLRKMVKGLRL